MEWKTQTVLIIKVLHCISKMKNNLDLFISWCVYFALVQFILYCGTVLWISVYPSSNEALNTTHRILIRSALKGFDKMNTSQLFDSLKIFNVNNFSSIS